MKRSQRIVTVFGSARPREGDAQYVQAHALGAALAGKGLAVCTGGYVGVMEAVSRGAKEAGGQTIGVTAKEFASRANRWVDVEIRVKSWQDRLFELVKRGHGYVACPGGTGTLAELAVVWEMLNKSLMCDKPIIAMGAFWQPVIECVRRAESKHGSSHQSNPDIHVRFAQSPSETAAYLSNHFDTRDPTRRQSRPKKAHSLV